MKFLNLSNLPPGAIIGPAMVLPVDRPQAVGRAPSTPGAMNKTEAAYWSHLTTLRAAGEILWCAFEPVKLRLADRTTYSPDFGVMLADRSLEFHETKGFVEDDAIAKFKVARELFWMFKFRLFKREKVAWVETYLER